MDRTSEVGVGGGARRAAPYVPKDGVGPRGAPECYYTSRALQSTARYERFVRRLRARELEQASARRAQLTAAAHRQSNDFFARCDRRSLINTVADRVNLCLASYEEGLGQKRQRLAELLRAEEEAHVRLLVRQAHEGAAAHRRKQLARLDELLARRRQEHEDQYAATPISKCSHIHPCLVKLRAKEAQEVQLYQMREKQLRQAAEREADQMWHDVAMKESEALAARLELDAVERRRREDDCARHVALQLEQLRQRRVEQRQLLQREALALRDELRRREKEVKEEKSKQLAEERAVAIREREELAAAESSHERRLQAAWGAAQARGDASGPCGAQKKRDLDECNRRLAELRCSAVRDRDGDRDLVLREGERLRRAEDLRRCSAARDRHRSTEETGAAVQRQLAEQLRRGEAERQADALAHEYERQVNAQLEELVRHEELTEARARGRHRADLLQQLKHNELLKERALRDELEQRMKCEVARQHYQEEIREMLCRPHHSDKQHPFASAMSAAMEARRPCPCAAPPSPPAPRDLV